MATAFVLINSEMGLEEEVLTALKGIDSVVEANVVYGVYDLVAKVQGTSSDELKNIILTQIRSLENVRSTLTMIVIEDHS
ncbi:MAG: Lrp/AsnC family transcriptional regulator [Candidatus Heimdallarchaeota archaeon]